MPSACMRSPSRDGGLGLRAWRLERNAWGTMRAWVLARRVSGLGGVLGYGSAGVESGAGRKGSYNFLEVLDMGVSCFQSFWIALFVITFL